MGLLLKRLGSSSRCVPREAFGWFPTVGITKQPSNCSVINHRRFSNKASYEDEMPWFSDEASNDEESTCFSRIYTFDICCSDPNGERFEIPEPSVHARKKGQKAKRASQKVLRPGMVLLKNYIPHEDQVKIVNICQKLGVGPGGFDRPSYGFGEKLNLRMMCLGLNWDPIRHNYDVIRAADGYKVPALPSYFSFLVQKAMQDSHALVKKEYNVTQAEDILPPMTPNACVVGFYTAGTGKLPLQQDNSESKESLSKGLPVVSFSIGDSAEFFYGDERLVSKAKKVRLESGDLLIFGGKARHVFNRVRSVIPYSAPTELLEETGLRPGHLSLSFRKA